jgi:hypothetical protein
MATYHELAPGDIKTARSFLNQLIDVLQEDISGSVSRRKYQHFVTGGVGPGVTSSLFQTVYDQDFTLQTSNPVFDITVGLAPNNILSGGIADTFVTAVDASGKALFPSSSLMMREKMDIYRQFSQMLLGNSDSLFKIPLDGGTVVDSALFLAFKRLFARDQIKRETFAMRFFQSASQDPYNLAITSESGSAIYTDLGSATQKFSTVGGQYGTIVDSAATSKQVGLMFYDAGVAVFDMSKIVSGSQIIQGEIDAMSSSGTEIISSSFIPYLLASASIDDIVDHVCATRFQSGSLTAITFQNVTNINSSLIFCRAAADEFNYSSNPTFVDTNASTSGRIVVIDPGEEDKQESFTYVTAVGMYDAVGNLLAVAKLSRPVEKSPERDLTFRVRLDF